MQAVQCADKNRQACPTNTARTSFTPIREPDMQRRDYQVDDCQCPSERTLISTPLTRRLGAHETPAIGMGCWAIGGPFWFGSQPLGWGEVDDRNQLPPFIKRSISGPGFSIP